MATKHYKKASPRQPVYVHGAPITFEKINIELCVFKTDDEGIQREFAALQARGVGGIFDISAEEYATLIEKKTTGSQASYREEFGKATLHQKINHPGQDLVSRVEDEPKSAPTPPSEPDAAPSAVAPSAVAPSSRPLPRRREKSS